MAVSSNDNSNRIKPRWSLSRFLDAFKLSEAVAKDRKNERLRLKLAVLAIQAWWRKTYQVRVAKTKAALASLYAKRVVPAAKPIKQKKTPRNNDSVDNLKKTPAVS